MSLFSVFFPFLKGIAQWMGMRVVPPDAMKFFTQVMVKKFNVMVEFSKISDNLAV